MESFYLLVNKGMFQEKNGKPGASRVSSKFLPFRAGKSKFWERLALFFLSTEGAFTR
jgi:hypothetical protein